MVNFRIIYKILGALLFIEAALMLLCLFMALYFGEDDIFTFTSSILITLIGAFTFRYFGRNSGDTLSRRDSFLVVTLAWIVFSAFGTAPFLIGGYLHTYTDAFFETMSGFTTTGATIIDNVEALPHGILFWRSLTQWIGGLGIVFFTVALLPSLVGGSTKVFAAEATGPIKTKLHPKLSMSARWIWIVYLFITFGCMACYMIFGMDWYQGVNYAMSSAATGGFSIHNNSTEFFNSPALEYTTTFFCFLSGVNFTLLYAIAAKFKFKQFWQDSELRFYIYIVLGFTLFVMLELIYKNGYGIERAFRCGIFQVVSFITTTGLYNDDAGKWPHVTWVVLSICMFIGACSGSTSGGFKAIRAVMVAKVVRNEFTQRLHPKALLPLKINGQNIPNAQRVSLLAFLTAYLLLLLLMAFIMIAMGIDNTNSITICLSCLGNVGPTLGVEIGPTMSWSVLPDFAKWMCSIMMLIGRLEIFTVLIILTPSFWTRN